MEGDIPIENQKCFSETLSTVSSCASTASNSIKVKKHVAIIESSSGSEDDSTDFDVSVLSFTCSGDYSAYVEESPSIASQEAIKIKNSHCTVIPDSDCDSAVGLSNINVSVNPPKFSKQIDWHSWSKKKRDEEKRKKEEEKQREQEKEEQNVAHPKNAAWVNWMCKKKEDEMKKQVNEIEACRREERKKKERRNIAQQKFEEWINKKKNTFKDKHDKSSEEEEKKQQKKLTKLKKWEDWYSQKKTMKVPKSFTHMNYPKPAWVNPVPWCHPDPSSSCVESIIDSD